MPERPAPVRFGSYAIPGHHGDFPTTLAFAADLEAHGFEIIGVGDSPGLFRDPYISMALIAGATSRARVATMVTNPVLRHPAAVAAAIGTVAELSGGRAVLGIGTGDSALHNSGQRPATLGTLERHIAAVRELLVNGSTVVDGNAAWMRWRAPHVPVFVAASGPRTLRLAGRVADGVVVATGVDPTEIASARQHITDGAAAVGRDLADIEVWWNVIISPGRERTAAIDAVRFGLAARAHHVFRAGVEGRNVPRDVAPRLAELVAGYRTREHGDHAAEHNAALVDSLDLAEFLASRFGVVGTVDECTDQLVALASLGVRNVITTMHGRDGFSLEPFATEVVPAVRTRT